MDWTHDGIVLSARKHGETSAIVTLLTREKGRHAGLVRGGAGKRQRGILQPGNLVHAHWRARLSEHLGTLTCELDHAHAAAFLHDAPRLAALSAACAVADGALPEREAHPAIFDGLVALLGALDGPSWTSVYVKWELGVLGELGYGLDLSCCAATGSKDNLIYVSPKTGRAVSASAGEPYKKALLALPSFLLAEGIEGGAAEISDGLGLTGYFLERHVFAAHDKALPAARRRLAERLAADAGSRPGP